MENTELIKALRCKSNDINNCTMCAYHNACYGGTLVEIAADALEAAEKRIAELEAQLPKEGEWIDLFGHDYKCSVCGEWYKMDGTPETEDMNYCPNCGAKMKKGEQE